MSWRRVVGDKISQTQSGTTVIGPLRGILGRRSRRQPATSGEIALPAAYAASPAPAILDKAATFGAVQHALYLPLGLSVLIGSVLATWLFATGRPVDRVIQAVFVFTALRNATRLLTSYAGVPLFPTAAYEAAYFPMVVVFYAPLAWWFVKRLPDDEEATASDRVGTAPG